MTGARIFKIVGWVLLGVAIAATLGLVLGLAVMWLWNWLMPDLFGLPEIDYWKAVGLFVLCHLLFKGHLAGGGGDHKREKEGCGPGGGHADRFARRLKDRIHRDVTGAAPGAAPGATPGAGHFSPSDSRSRARFITSMKSLTSRNSRYTLANRTYAT